MRQPADEAPDHLTGKAGAASAAQLGLTATTRRPGLRLSGIASTESMLLSRGDMVDHFKVIDLLGRGGMGEVYLARDTKLGRKVALKLIHRRALGSDDAVARFLFEARTTAQFSHPNIVTVYAVGEHNGLPYLALEYLHGQTLHERIKSEERFSPREVARIGIAIANALADAHLHQVLHRDLKPANVLLPSDGRLRVVDFGLARHLEGGLPTLESAAPMSSVPSAHQTDLAQFHTDESMKGTPRYMAPEQWAEEPLDGATDVWALGVILYELLAAEHPFSHSGLEDLCIAVCRPDPFSPTVEISSLPAPLVDLITRCLEKKPSKRPLASTVAEQLESFLQFGSNRSGDGECPFRGLLPFTEQHAGSFFGRDVDIERCVEQLRHQAVLPVVGPSGAGKSSFVRAGIIARLQDQEPWLVLRIRPGSRPFETLAQQLLGSPDADFRATSLDSVLEAPFVAEGDAMALANELERQPGRLGLELRAQAEQRGTKLLLFVDQLEELVTLIDSETQRSRFMDALCQAADEALDPVRIVLTVRDDFVGRLATTSSAREALSKMFFLQRPGSDALEATLRKPVAAAGYAYDDLELPTEMVTAVCDELACLPLLQFAAQQLWDTRDRNQRLLRRKAYQTMGGVEGALVQHADGLLDELSTTEVQKARQLLMRLVTSDRTRKVMPLDMLLDGLGDEAKPVLERLTGARLLTVRKRRGASEPRAQVELAHESLIARWETLRRWLDEGQDELVFLADASQAAQLWKKRGQRTEELWQDDALRDALRLLEKSSQPVPDSVQHFVGAAKRKEIRRRRVRRWVLAAVTTILALVVVVLLVQNQLLEEQQTQAQQERATAEQERAHAHRQGAAALVEGARGAAQQGRPLEARAKLRLALEGVDAPTARALWWQLQDEPLVWKQDFGSIVYGVAFSHDGKYMAAACQDKSVYLLDTQTRAMRVLRGHHGQVLSVAFRAANRELVSSDHEGNVRLWATGTGEQLRSFTESIAPVRTTVFSPDGSLVGSGGDDGTVRIREVKTGELRHSLIGHEVTVNAVTFSPDGRWLASGGNDSIVRLWDVRTGELAGTLTGHSDGIRSLSFNSDGHRLASGSADRTVRLWNTRTGELQRTLVGHTARVDSVSFNPSGQVLASGGNDASVKLWDAHSGQEKQTFYAHKAGIRSVHFSPDGRWLASAGIDKTVRLWDPYGEKKQHVPSGHTAAVHGISFAPHDNVLASASNDKTVRVWDTHTGQELLKLSKHTRSVYSVDFSPDGRVLASGSRDKTIRLWDANTGEQQRTLTGHKSGVWQVAFSPGGDLLASASDDTTVRLWDPRTGKQRHILSGHRGPVYGLGFGNEAPLVASGSNDRTVRIWDTRSGAQLHNLSGHSSRAMGATFSPDDKSIASGGADKAVYVWDARTGERKLVIDQLAGAHYVHYHPDGRRVGVPCTDGVTRIWDIDRREVVTELQGHSGEVNHARFSPDGKAIATSSDDSTVRLWEVATGKPLWRSPLLLAAPPRLFSHRGWTALDATGAGLESQPTGEQWQAAVKQRARFAAITPGGALLCMQSFDNDIELWALARDIRLQKKRIAHLSALHAVSGGCLARTASKDGGRALLIRPEGEPQTLAVEGEVTAASAGNNELFIAAGAHIVIADARGIPMKRVAASIGITSIARIDATQLAVGYSNGSLELVPVHTEPSSAQPTYSFEQTPSSPVTRILLGPMDTLIAGYGNGAVGVWSWRDGQRLADGRIHGPVEHVLLEDQKLYAASSLGQHLVWNLSALYAERCALLREVWDRVPVVWRDGRAVAESPPASHACLAGTPP